MQISLIDLILCVVFHHQALCESHSCYHYYQVIENVVKFLQSYMLQRLVSQYQQLCMDTTTSFQFIYEHMTLHWLFLKNK